MLKEFLSQKKIPYRERDVSRDYIAAQELVARTGQLAVPVIMVDGQTIIGFNRERLEQIFSQVSPKPSFGAAIADASKITARYGTNVAFGAYVGSVRPGSTAERVGLRRGDIIIELNARRINNASDLESALATLSKGSRFSLVFTRDGSTQRAEGTLS